VYVNAQQQALEGAINIYFCATKRCNSNLIREEKRFYFQRFFPLLPNTPQTESETEYGSYLVSLSIFKKKKYIV